MNTGRFKDKVALVTGGASGIAREIVERLVADGARVAVGDIDEQGLARVAEELGDAVAVLRTNVRAEQDVAALVELAATELGGLDTAFNVAGAGGPGMLTDLALTDWDAVVATVLTGTFLSMKHEARLMAATGGGAIVNVSSINASQAAQGLAAYCTAKAGVVMLTKCGGLELAADRIRVNAVAPGLVDTPMTAFQREIPAMRQAYLDVIPLDRVGRTSDIASAALFLASDEADWITGVDLAVDGGQVLSGYPNLMKVFAETGSQTYDAHLET